jgi:adenylate cyclase
VSIEGTSGRARTKEGDPYEIGKVTESRVRNSPGMAEIERKFLAGELPPEMRAQPSTRIRQAYLSIEPAEVRVRSSDDRAHELTVKSVGGLERTEVTVPLSPEQFDELWALADTTIEKDRSAYGIEGGTAEVDVYDGKLGGLVVVEVEFSTEADAASFAPPSWFGVEVTEDRRYRNSALARAQAPPE